MSTFKEASSVATFKACVAALKEFGPDFFLLENVDLGDGDDPDSNLSHIVEMLESCGYKVKFFKVSALDYGLPQRRVRIYLAGFHCHKQPLASFTRVEKVLALTKLKTQSPAILSSLDSFFISLPPNLFFDF